LSWLLNILPWVLTIALLLGLYLTPNLVLYVLYQDQTFYAEGYSRDQWTKIHTGMNKEEVIRILGYPLSIREMGEKGETYRTTRYNKDGFMYEESYFPNVHPPSDYDPNKIIYSWFSYSEPGKWLDSYNVRAIKIDKDGKVIKVQSEYYWD
ncbi:MAG: hypothetical protein ACWGQW_18240, partial [bacterium]